MRKVGAARELTRRTSARFIVTGYGLVPKEIWLANFADPESMIKAHFCYKDAQGLWCLGNTRSVDQGSANSFVVRFFDHPGPVKIRLRDDHFSTAETAQNRAWVLQRHLRKAVNTGVSRNFDMSRNVHG